MINIIGQPIFKRDRGSITLGWRRLKGPGIVLTSPYTPHSKSPSNTTENSQKEMTTEGPFLVWFLQILVSPNFMGYKRGNASFCSHKCIKCSSKLIGYSANGITSSLSRSGCYIIVFIPFVYFGNESIIVSADNTYNLITVAPISMLSPQPIHGRFHFLAHWKT